MKILKGIVKVVAIVASIAALIPGPHQPIAAAIAAVASAVSMGLEIISPTKARSARLNGSPTDYRLDPNAGIPYAMGRTQFAGNAVRRGSFGSDNKFQAFATVYSYGPIDGFEQFTADLAPVNFDAAGMATGGLSGWMALKTQLGFTPSAWLAPPTMEGQSWPNWPVSAKLSGLAASIWQLVFDVKNGKKFTGGPPRPGMVLRGVKVYDPRKDSTYPGGNGTCRALDESTYVYSETPHLHALTFALGRYQSGKRRLGIGMPVTAIDVQYFVDAANIDEANNWKVSGVVYSTDGKWNVLKQIMECGAAGPSTLGARLSGQQSAPKIAIDTINADQVVGRASFTATQSRRDRINGGIPRYRSEAHGWEYVPASTVRIGAYVGMDGGERTREFQWDLVANVKQASQLTAYQIYDARELGPIELDLKLRWVGLKPGDCVTLNVPVIGMVGQRVVLVRRSFDPSSGGVSCTFRTETNEKHAAALALNGTAPPVVNLTVDKDAIPAAPPFDHWAVVSGALSAVNQGSIPALRFQGSVQNTSAESVEFNYRKLGSSEWISAGIFSANVTKLDVPQVEPNAFYYGQVIYIVGGRRSTPMTLGPVQVTKPIASTIVGQAPTATSSDWSVISGLNKPEDKADVTSFIVPSVEGDITISATSAGVPKPEQFPKPIDVRLVRNGFSIYDGISWSWLVLSGTVNGFTNANGFMAVAGVTGQLSFPVNSISNNGARVRFMAQYQGTTRTLDKVITVEPDAAPVGGGGGATGGGGGGGTTSGGSSSQTTAFLPTGGTSTGYDNSLNQLNSISTGAAGAIDFTAPLNFEIGGTTNGSLSAYAVWQYKLPSSTTWIDAGVEIAAETGASRYQQTTGTGPNPILVPENGTSYNTPGYIAANRTVTGLPINTAFDVRLCLRDTSTTRSAFFSGTATASGR